MDSRTYEEWVRQQNRQHKIRQRVKWMIGILFLLVGVGSCMHCKSVSRAEYSAWEKTVTPEENARIDGLMEQVAEGEYGDMLLMKDGSVVALWNSVPTDPKMNGGQAIYICVCESTSHECSKGSRYQSQWNRRDFSLVERFVKKNPADPEWNRLAGKFLLQ